MTTATILIFVMLFLSIPLFSDSPVELLASGGTMYNWDRSLPQLEQIVFQSPTGSVHLTPLLTTISGRGYSATAFTLADPRPLTGSTFIRSQSLDARINSRVLTAVLMYRYVFTLQQVMQQTGLVISQDQLYSAVQLALWRMALPANPQFQIQEASVADTTVRTLATHIISWATTQVNNMPSNQDVIAALSPSAQPQVNSSQAVMQNDGVNITFGPYMIQSVLPTEMRITANNGGVIVNQAGHVVEAVSSNQPFFIRMPVIQTGIVQVTLSSSNIEREFRHYRNRVWLAQRDRPQEIRFNVSSSPGSHGILQVHLTDSLTAMPLQNVTVNVLHNNNIISTGQTNVHGAFSYELPVANYTLQIVHPPGYMAIMPYHFEVSFIGDVQIINLELSRSEAIMSFFAINENTNAPVPYAEAFIFEEGNRNPVRRIAFSGCSAQGLAFAPGNYIMSIYMTTGGYAVSGQVAFTVEAGTLSDLVIPLTPNVPRTTVTLENTLNHAHWLFSIYRGDEYLFTLPVQGGTLDFYLPQLEAYQVVARTTDGTFGPFFANFQVTSTPQEVLIGIQQGTETITFQFVDIYLNQPIPNVVAGIFDENHNIIQMGTANLQGAVQFTNLIFGQPYFINVLAAPPGVSGYSAVGNRFLGRTRHLTIELYSLEHIQEYSGGQDAIIRMANVVWNGPSFRYPFPPAPPAYITMYPHYDPVTGQRWRYDDESNRIYRDHG